MVLLLEYLGSDPGRTWDSKVRWRADLVRSPPSALVACFEADFTGRSFKTGRETRTEFLSGTPPTPSGVLHLAEEVLGFPLEGPIEGVVLDEPPKHRIALRRTERPECLLAKLVV